MPFIPDNNNNRQSGFIPDKKYFSGFGENILKSGANVIKDTVGGITNIVNPNLDENTLFQIGNLAKGIVDSIIPGQQGSEQYAQQLADYFIDRYGSLDKIANTFYNDPVGLLDDVSIALTAGGSSVSKIGKLGKLSKVADFGQDVARFGNKLDPVTMPFKGVSNVSDKIGDFSQGFRKNMGNNLLDEASNAPLRGLGRNKLTENMLAQIAKTGMTTDEFFDKYNLWGRDIDEVNQTLKSIYKDYTNTAYKSGTQFDVREMVKIFDKEIERLKPIAQQSDSARQQLETIINKKQAFLNSLVENDAINLNQNIGRIAEAKSYVGEDIPDSMFNMGASSKGKALGAKRTYGMYKGFLDSKTGGKTAELGSSISALENYKKLLNKNATARSGNKQMSFPKMVAPAAGGILGGFPGAVAAYGAEQLANSPSGLKTYSKATKSMGETLKNYQTPKIEIPKNVKDVTDKTYQTARFLRLNEREKRNPFKRIKQ